VFLEVGDTVAEDEVVCEIETDKVQCCFTYIHLISNCCIIFLSENSV